jgi:FlaG/FlaF family flagellin (archaellin)
MPLEAHDPSPADGATEVGTTGQLKWTAGQGAMAHMVYLGTDQAAVEAGDVSLQVAASGEPTYDFTGLAPFTTYYWRVDEVSSTGQTVPGPVWSFSTPSYLPLNEGPVTLDYNNSAAPSVTQVELTSPANWTIGGLSDLTLQFTGRPASFTETDTGITVIAAGADIYQQTDEFCYVCKKLIGDGSITVRVDRLDLTNAWAKAGVMIRENLSPAVKQAHTIVSGSNGIEFQYRPDVGANTTQFATSGGTPPLPQWVRLTRTGDTFTGETSSDGQTWTQIVSGASVSVQDLVMGPEVYIGLAVTSHVAGTTTTAEFSNITTTGDVSGDWLAVNIAGDQPGNSPADLYAAVEDAAGQVAVVQFGDPAATTIAQPWSWKIPLSAFASVDLTNVARLYLGAGDLENPVAGGNGIVTFDNVSVILPVVLKKGMDVTAPGDNVLGVPNDGVNTGGSASGWPAAETPPLAIDDNVNTKFLHFKGEMEPTGFQVQVMAGPTLVTGLTFTTANDSPERDPVSFELAGSNDGLAGPWTLIASGDIVDFAGATAWPRFTKNTTPITFENQTAYKFYQVMFPAVRDPGSANSMQIAEVELIDGGVNVMWVSDAYDDKPDGIPDDQGWIDFLQGQGYNVEYRKGPAMGNGYWRTLDQDKIDALNAADLVIVSRNTDSGSYDDGDEIAQWNSVTSPLILMSSHIVRSSRWKWLNTDTINSGVPPMKPADAASPTCGGVTLTTDGLVDAIGAGLDCSLMGIADAGNGTVLATRADTGDVWIASWDAGVEFYAGAGQIAGGPRVFFTGGTQEVKPTIGRGEMNLTDSGQAVFLNVIDMLLP